MPRVFEIQIQADVFVGRVGARVGITQPGGRDGQAEIMHEGMAGSRSADQRDELHRHFKNFLCGVHDDLDFQNAALKGIQHIEVK